MNMEWIIAKNDKRFKNKLKYIYNSTLYSWTDKKEQAETFDDNEIEDYLKKFKGSFKLLFLNHKN